MSRGRHNLSQTDLTKAIKAAAKSGVKNWRVEVDNGKIVVLPGGAESVDNDAKPPSSEWD
jgi:hypothetical protein